MPAYPNALFKTRINLAFVFMIFLFLLGSFGYHYIEGWTLFDGFYMTFITITTIGFREVTELSAAGRVLTMFIALTGIGTVAYIASQTAQRVFELDYFKERAQKQRIEKMNGHYIICGFGRIGRRIAKVLHQADLPIVVVDNNASVIESVDKLGLAYVSGNAQQEEALIEAGVHRAKALVCALSRDQDNVFVTLIARELNPDIFILVRTNQFQNIKKILREGANKVISPYEIGADRMANVLLRPNVDSFMDNMMKGERDDHVFDEIRVMADSPMVGKSLSEIGLRQQYSVVIVAVIEPNNSRPIFNPDGTHKILEDEILIVLGIKKDIDKFRTEGCLDNRSISERASEYAYLKPLT